MTGIKIMFLFNRVVKECISDVSETLCLRHPYDFIAFSHEGSFKIL